jgi:hypothetical protein
MKDNGDMDFPMDLEEFYMTMGHYIKDVLTMVLHNASRLYSFGLMEVFLEVEFDKIRLTDTANCLQANFFIKGYGKTIYQMEKLDKFIPLLRSFRVNL